MSLTVMATSSKDRACRPNEAQMVYSLPQHLAGASLPYPEIFAIQQRSRR